MKQLALDPAFGSGTPVVLTFYGGGGKTALLSALTAEMATSGSKVLLTTTTKIRIPAGLPLFVDIDSGQLPGILKKHFKSNQVAVVGKKILKDQKLEGISSHEIKQLRDQLEVSILVEGDGSRGLPLKGYAPHEPVLPSCSDLIAAVIGADAIGRPLNAGNVHRPDQFTAATGTVPGAVITEKTAGEAFNYMLELGLRQAPDSEQICILNKADLLDYPGLTAINIALALAEQENCPGRLLLTALKDPNPVKITLPFAAGKPLAGVSCIVLAAGTSSRMGQDKLSLPLGDLTILEQTLTQVTEAGFEEIIVVIKPGSPWPEKLNREDYTLVENRDYRTGLASSLQSGLKAVNNKIQGVLFALGDQPLVPSSIYRQLVKSYRSNLNLVTCPTYRGKRGNPTIFDRRAWPQLMKLSGDCGGRAILDKLDANEIILLETGLPAVTRDVDTPESYRKLLDLFPTWR